VWLPHVRERGGGVAQAVEKEPKLHTWDRLPIRIQSQKNLVCGAFHLLTRLDEIAEINK